MVKLDKSNLVYKQQDFFVGLSDQWEKTNKIWLIALLVVVVASIPSSIGLKAAFSRQFISSYVPPEVFTDRFNPTDLEVVRIGLLPVTDEVSSAFAQILNPNPALSAHRIDYSFVFKDRAGQELGRASEESYILAGESRFLVFPRVELLAADSVELVFDEVRWTDRLPQFDTDFSVLQPRSGINAEGKFFAEGLIRNEQSFEVRNVDVAVLVFDRSNQKIRAVNSTVLNHLTAFESRFFRLIWPIDFPEAGIVQIEPSVNPFDPGLQLEEIETVPVR